VILNSRITQCGRSGDPATNRYPKRHKSVVKMDVGRESLRVKFADCSARVRAPGLRVELATAEKSIRFIDKNVPREPYSSPMDVRAGLAGRGAENAKGQRLTGRGSPTHAGTFE
jgi:hypothetical protein